MRHLIDNDGPLALTIAAWAGTGLATQPEPPAVWQIAGLIGLIAWGVGALFLAVRRGR